MSEGTDFGIGVIVAIVLVVVILAIAYYMADEFVTPPTGDPYSGILVATNNITQGSCVVVAHHEGWWYAVTAQHVTTQGTETLLVDQAYESEIVRIDPQMDLALIRFQSPEVYATYGFADAEMGESCRTVGWYDDAQVAYEGAVVTLYWTTGLTASNTGVHPGCSGGALLNEDGQLIGMTIAMSAMYGGVLDSTVFAVPSRYLEAMTIVIPAVHELVGE